MKQITCTIILFMLLSGCAQNTIEHQITRPIEKAHNVNAWRETSAMAAAIDVEIGGQTAVDADFLIETNGPKARMDYRDGTVVLFDGRDAFVVPASAQPHLAGFHVRSWPQFIETPFRLRDADVELTELGHMPLKGRQHRTARMTVAPNDWHILYRDLDTNRLCAQSYFVDLNSSTAAKDEQPHAICYEDYRMVDGIPVPLEWTFWHWDASRGGVFGKQIGRASLSNVRFLTPPEDVFDVPADARKLALTATE